jgi:hypothetical protein
MNRNRNRIHMAALVFVGVALGCGASAVAPVVATSHAQAQAQAPGRAGSWDCFVVDRLPDVTAARSWKPATDITEGLNQAAPEAATGTMIAVTPKSSRDGSSASVTCVKH